MSSELTLTPQQERFAQLVVERGNLSAAYRGAYDVGPNTTFSTIAVEASRLAAHPAVSVRIRQLQDEAAERSALPSLAARIAEQREIECANAADIIALKWVNCRRCRGEGHAHQWKDAQEYAQAMQEARRRHDTTYPDLSGGFGFNPWLEPVVDCPGCFGVGERVPWIADISKLQGPARRLYKGVKLKADGSVEILFHDQQKATDMLNRIQGAYKDGAIAPPKEKSNAAEAARSQATPEERLRTYLRTVAT